MIKKSNKLYGIMILDKEENRDQNLSKLLEMEYTPKAKDKSTFISSTSILPYYEKKGAENYLSKIKTGDTQQNKVLYVVEITDLWNIDIDERIKTQTKIFDSNIKHLNSLKIK